MIDFRYHLVSLIAVFMALATGILVGSSLLNQSLIDLQKSELSAAQKEKEELRVELDEARNGVLYRDEYLAALDSSLLAGRLLGQRVVLLSMPNSAGDQADALTQTLTTAGAQVTGRVTVNEDFFATGEDPRDKAVRGETRDAIVARHALPEVPPNPGAKPDANVHLAAALMTQGPDRPVTAPARKLLTELDRAGLIGRGDLSDRADLAVLLVGPPPDEALGATDRTRRGLVGLAAAIDAAGQGAVVVGPAEAAVGGAMDEIKEAEATESVSTVDSVDSVFGRVATAYALVEQMAGQTGHYGVNSDRDAVLPEVPAAATVAAENP